MRFSSSLAYLSLVSGEGFTEANARSSTRKTRKTYLKRDEAKIAFCSKAVLGW